MKKIYVILAALAVAAMTLASCKPADDPKGPDQPDQPDQPDDPVVETLKFDIDGDFSDWDALTADKADDNNVILTPSGDYKAIKVFKVSSDAANIYCYAEVAIDKVQQSETAIEGGNSNDGHGDATPGPLTVYWDLDGDPATGFIAQHTSSTDLLVEGVGCEAGTEMYLFIDTKDSKCKLGWSQIVYEPDEAQDGDLYQGDWGSDTSNPQYGWAPDLDNLAPSLENYATAVGSTLKIEWSIERNTLAGLCKRGHNMGTIINVGASWNNGDSVAAFSYGEGRVGPATITLK